MPENLEEHKNSGPLSDKI